MHFLNSVMLISCESWPLLFLLLGATMWLLGWLFGRSKVSTLQDQVETQLRKNKRLISENGKFESDIKVIKSDYDRTNKSLISAKNNLEENNNKLKTALSKTRILEIEKNNLISEKTSLVSDKNKLVAERGLLISEKDALKNESLNAADANISNATISDLKDKLIEAERALAACEASKIKQNKTSFVAPPPPSVVPPKSNDEVNKFVSGEMEIPSSKLEEDNVSFVAPPPTIVPPKENDDINKLSSDYSNTGKGDINKFASGDMAAPISSFSPGKPSTSEKMGMGAHFKNNNLQIMDGVGPKIESILQAAGYNTWDDIANASEGDLQKVLDDAGPRYRMHNPTAWSEQGRFAANGEWDKLVEYQKGLDSGSSGASSKAEKLYFKALGFAAAKSDDLKVVEGIGPKIESLLKNAGVQNWQALAESEVGRLQDILTSAGDRYRLADPATWPKQAELADAGKWNELKEYQDFLSGGKA